MAQFLTVDEVRNYPLSNGETADLIALIANVAPYNFVPATKDNAPVGTAAYVDAMGQTRRGVVVKHTPTKIQVAITTQGAVDTATHPDYYNNRVRVQIVSVPTGQARVAPPAAKSNDEVLAEVVQVEVETAHTEALTEDAQRADEGRWVLGSIEDMHALALLENSTLPAAADWDESIRETDEWGYTDEELGEEVVVTATGAIVNQGALNTYNGAYLLRGDRESAMATLHRAALLEDSWRNRLTLNSHDGKVRSISSEDDRTEEPEMTSTQMHEAKALATATKIREAAKAFPNDSRTPAEGEQVMTLPLTTQTDTGSAVVLLLERVWDRIRANHPELPEVVIITGSGLVGASKWGHFRADGWKVSADGTRKHEMFMAGETFAKGATQVLQTMLHEGAHTLAKVRKIDDTSRQGRWHNKEFKRAAEEMGLEHKGTQADKAHGYSFVTLTETTKTEYADLLADLDREIRLVCHLPLWMGGTAEQDGEEDKGGEKITGKPKGPATQHSGSIKAVCECEEPNIVRMSRKVLDKRVVTCDECEAPFTEAAA